MAQKMSKVQARNWLVENLGHLYILAQQSIDGSEESDLKFWELVDPVGRALFNSALAWDREVQTAWLKVSDVEGYNNTFRLLGVASTYLRPSDKQGVFYVD